MERLRKHLKELTNAIMNLTEEQTEYDSTFAKMIQFIGENGLKQLTKLMYEIVIGIKYRRNAILSKDY